MGETYRLIRVREWVAGISLALGVGFGIFASGLGVFAGLISAVSICAVVSALDLVNRRRKRQSSGEDPYALQEGLLYTLIALIASGAWFGVSSGRLYCQYLIGSETKAGEWVILIAPIISFGAQGAGLLKRPSKTEKDVSRNRAAAYVSLGIAFLLALLLLGATLDA